MKKVFFLIFVIFFAKAQYCQERIQKPNILLITIDTWRSDYLSISNSAKVETPNIDKFAKEGIYIKECETPCPATTPAHASILTGLYPKNHGIRDNHHFKLKSDIKTVTQVLKENNYKTVAVVSAAPLRAVYGLNRGFDFYDDEGLGVAGDESLLPSSRQGEKSAQRALNIIKSKEEKPLFLWVHLYEPHRPYEPPPEYKKKYKDDLYGGEVAYADKIVGDFTNRLFQKVKGRWVVVITGDHGEGLGDNIEKTHGLLLYKETRNVPLIIYDSEKKLTGNVRGIKSLLNISPTILNLLSIDFKCDGKSIFDDTSGRILYGETLLPLTGYSVNGGYSVKIDERSFIKHGTSREIYFKNNERNNLLKSEKEFFEKADGLMKNFFGNAKVASTLKLSSEEMNSLKSLGYIGGATISEGTIKEVDLREFVKDIDRFETGRSLLTSKKYSEALLYYDDFLKKYPDASSIYLEKATLLINLGKFEESKEALKKCLSLDPKNSTAYLDLGNIFVMEKKYKEAEKCYLTCLKFEEESEAHLNLGLLYAQFLNDKNSAVKHLKTFLKLAPEDPEREKIKAKIKEIEGQK
jgi:tetratricopeptide (TPR) repeat protein